MCLQGSLSPFLSAPCSRRFSISLSISTSRGSGQPAAAWPLVNLSSVLFLRKPLGLLPLPWPPGVSSSDLGGRWAERVPAPDRKPSEGSAKHFPSPEEYLFTHAPGSALGPRITGYYLTILRTYLNISLSKKPLSRCEGPFCPPSMERCRKVEAQAKSADRNLPASV